MSRPSSPLLLALRAATACLHRDLELRGFGARIASGDLHLPEYRSLIAWQRAAHLALEPRVLGLRFGDYAYQSRLPLLGVAELPTPVATPTAEALGVAYVLEGSSLGGAVIHRQLLASPRLAASAPFPFYAALAAEGPRRWKRWVTAVAATEFTQEATEAASRAAAEAFGVFARCLPD